MPERKLGSGRNFGMLKTGLDRRRHGRDGLDFDTHANTVSDNIVRWREFAAPGPSWCWP